MKRLLAVFFTLMSSAALAQTADTATPVAAPAQPPVAEDAPSGGCMPIGLTASGEIVYPIQCKGSVDRQRGAAVEQKPAAVEEKPVVVEQKPAAVEEKPAAKQSQAATANSQPEKKPAEAIPLPKRADPRARAISSNDCTHYRSYNPASGTYKAYDGQIYACRISSR